MTERLFGSAEQVCGTSGFGVSSNAARSNELGDYPHQVVALTLSRFDAGNVPWAISQMQWSKAPLRALPGLGFLKLMGTGAGAGFSTVPNLGVWTILSTWANGAAALRAQSSDVFEKRRRRSAETATIFLAPISSRGRWARVAPFEPRDDSNGSGPIAALTRATVRPSKLAKFWRRVPSISRTIEGEAAVQFMIGMGEVPYLHQVTFSIWNDAEAMASFSRQSATHGEAVRRVADEGWFSEQLFARFRPLGANGHWNGKPAQQLIGHA